MQVEISGALDICDSDRGVVGCGWNVEKATQLLQLCFKNLTSSGMTQLRLQGKDVLTQAMQRVHDAAQLQQQYNDDPSVLNEVVTNAPASNQTSTSELERTRHRAARQRVTKSR